MHSTPESIKFLFKQNFLGEERSLSLSQLKMYPRYRSLRQISKFLPHICSGNHLQRSRKAINLSASSLISLLHSCHGDTTSFHFQRYSTISKVSNEPSSAHTPQVHDVLSFIQSAFKDLQGPNHCWLNIVEGNADFFKRDGTFLVLVGQFIENSQVVGMLEKVKSLQQKFSWLHVMGFQSGSLIFSNSHRIQLVELVMKEYITFPILLSNKNFFEMENEPCYLLFQDFSNPVICHENGLDLGMLKKAVEKLHAQQTGSFNNGNSGVPNLFTTWLKQAEVIKEPQLCSSLQNLLLNFPGCVSADESGDRLFISDSNHHRIIIVDGNGKILDCIGSSPGFEDGEFESAKLARPAASFYHDAEDCLYIVDSENHAIRKADMERRVLETLYPSTSKKNNSIWTWIVDKLGFGSNVDVKSEEYDCQSLLFPWHLFKSTDDSFLIINRSFETMWLMDLASGEIKELILGFPRILETCEQLIMEKVSLLKQMPRDWLQQQVDANCSLQGLPYASLLSSVTTFQSHTVVCDTVAQRVVKLNRESGTCSNIQFSNFGILGLPYWLSYSLERVCSAAGSWTDHLQCFSLLPGRIDIRLNVDIPVDTELVEPLQEGCIWHQARGSATEVLGANGVVGSSEKVGVAQQWYDELDNLAFSTAESEMVIKDDKATSDSKSQAEGVHIDCAVNTSPGTSEVIIYAALYLRLKRHPDIKELSQERYAARIAEILTTGKGRGTEKDSCIQLLLKLNKDLRDLVFIRPLHARIKLDSLNHPKGDNYLKDIILTDSSIEVNVSLET